MTKIFIGIILGTIISFFAVSSTIRDGKINIRKDFNYYEEYKCEFVKLTDLKD